MTKYRQPFLSLLTKLWVTRFPQWRLGASTPVFWARRDCTFTYDAPSSAGRFFHAVINFTPKTPGRFTADIVVTPSIERLPERDVYRSREDIPSLKFGSYRIGFFGDGRDRWWRLADDTLDPYGTGIVLHRHPHDWYAPSYALPLPEIMRHAAIDFSDSFERDVIPKLENANKALGR